MTQTAIGICLGASNIKVVELSRGEKGVFVKNAFIRRHESNPRAVLNNILSEMSIPDSSFGAFTGKKFREIVKAESITEAEAVEYALSYDGFSNELQSEGNVLVSLGAESFIAYLLNSDATINDIETGNKCASGTGEFFLQQIKRMNVSVSEAISLSEGTDLYPVSGRCSVFCKSDCTHALNKGIPIGRVSSGLCKMMAEKVSELLEKMAVKNVIAIGGVTHNSSVMKYLLKEVDTLVIPDHADYFEALGAAYYALTKEIPLNISPGNIFKENISSFSTLAPLKKAEELVTFETGKRGRAEEGDRCIVGLDVGSTTTKAVLLRTSDDAVLASEYLRTNGDPVKASRECFASIDNQIKSSVEIVALGVTGSGRYIAGLHASATSIINEIIAHATGAAYYDKEVDTIFEIGG